MIKLFTEIMKFINSHKVNAIFVIIIIFVVFDFIFMGISKNDINKLRENLTNTITDYKVEYALNVVTYGLKDDLTDQEVKDQIREWIELEWGAQIGALQTICDTDPSYLYSLMSEDLATEVCRSVS